MPGAPLQVLVKGNLTIQGSGALHADGRGAGTPGQGGNAGDGVFNAATNPGGAGTAGSPPAGFNSTVFTASGAGGAGGGGALDVLRDTYQRPRERQGLDLLYKRFRETC
jgi:hypothetical protein